MEKILYYPFHTYRFVHGAPSYKCLTRYTNRNNVLEYLRLLNFSGRTLVMLARRNDPGGKKYPERFRGRTEKDKEIVNSPQKPSVGEWEGLGYHVLEELKRMRAELNNIKEGMTQLKVNVGMLNVKAGIWAVIGGAVSLASLLIIQWLKNGKLL